jgi:hypothetical protein
MPMPQESVADAVWSEHERELAENAEVVKDLDTLLSTVSMDNASGLQTAIDMHKLDSFYSNGVKPVDAYIRIPNSLIRG